MTVALATSLGDDALILGQRLAEWCGHAPTLEVDLALANIGLDLLGQAQFFLGAAGAAEGQGRDADTLAYRRREDEFRNCLLVEQPNGDFARTIARQFLFSTWQALLFPDLAQSAAPAIAAIAQKAAKEVAYHARFAAEWVVRLGDGTSESHRRMADGLAWCWRFTDELFMDDTAKFRPEWDSHINATLTQAGLATPKPVRGITGGRHGRHTEHLGHILSALQYLQRVYPDATW
ncbi:MAG: phenylacetate-CoA oxygenase subunit PaaC [Acidocella sp.]|nr:phenylacetate-CoA oxygenase subunit PaaC [Acidocella sp.]